MYSFISRVNVSTPLRVLILGMCDFHLVSQTLYRCRVDYDLVGDFLVWYFLYTFFEVAGEVLMKKGGYTNLIAESLFRECMAII